MVREVRAWCVRGLMSCHKPCILKMKIIAIILKGTCYENNTFPGIWGVVLGLWCSHTHKNFEKSLYMIF